MATEVLRPQELLGDRFSRPATSFNRLSTIPANGILAMKQNQQGKSSTRSDRKRSKATLAGKRSVHGGVTDRHRKGEITSGGLTMGQVTLLKRGESLSSISSEIPKPSPPQKIVPKKNRLAASAAPADMFAGSCISPPSPRSLPLPSFFNKKVDSNSSEDGATMFLRRVLRLE